MTKRIRGRKLQRIRAQAFSEMPLCVKCKEQGRVTAAEELDHVTALCKGGTDTPDNRQPLCKACHKAKTAEDMGHAPRIEFNASGRVQW